METGRDFLLGVSETDEGGNIVGAVGLSQKQYAHSFKVNGIDLTTWCAWDTLFIAQVLGDEAEVTSLAPGTEKEIAITIGRDGAVATPAESVVSVVLLDPEQIDMDSLESIYMTFCHQIYFFSSRTEAEEWTKDRGYDFAILSVDDAYRLGAVAFEDVRFAYNDEDWILKDVSFHLEPGEKVAIVCASVSAADATMTGAAAGDEFGTSVGHGDVNGSGSVTSSCRCSSGIANVKQMDIASGPAMSIHRMPP